MRWWPWLVIFSTGANAATDAGQACLEIEQRLVETQRTLASCNENSRSASATRERCLSQLEEAQSRLNGSSSQVESCVTAREQQCLEAAAFAAGILNGHAGSVGACIHPSAVADIQTLLDAWFGLDKSLQQLDDYASGVSDKLPRVIGTTDPERHLARVLGLRTGVPLWNRRLLVEAFRLTAPTAFGELKAQGSLALEGFFESRGPLPERFVHEAEGEHNEPPGPAGPPRTAALKITLAFLHIANCEDRPGAGECVRAHQLVDLLDKTGPLIIQRRVEEIDDTPCEALGPETLRAWLQDFPASRVEKGVAPLEELTEGARRKLFHCYLADEHGDPAYAKWVASRLPPRTVLDARGLKLVDALSRLVSDGDPLDRCGRAVRALQGLEAPADCGLDQPIINTLAAWAESRKLAGNSTQAELCQRVASGLWAGEAVVIPTNPTDSVQLDSASGPTAMGHARSACDERRGTGDRFERRLAKMVAIAHASGEPVDVSPFRVASHEDARPVESVRFEQAAHYRAWIEQRVIGREETCDALGLSKRRCEACRELGPGVAYDCELSSELGQLWVRYRRFTFGAAAALAALGLLLSWARRVRWAERTFGAAIRLARGHLEGLGLPTQAAAFRRLLPARLDTVLMELPRTPVWERWGVRACAVVAPGTTAVREADVNHAAQVALREDVRVVFLLHADSAAPDLGAVRATLDWAARGGSRAVQVLPLPLSRLTWATREEDLLDLVETTTLRGNPFEVRGPVRSSSQFWNRERLVAGLLTQARAGSWVVVTGLRRFGKSSLALEVSRRSTGPSAYVDLAGFSHEVTFGDTSAVAVEAVLRTLAMRLVDSARERYPAVETPPLPAGPLDAPALAQWLNRVAAACGTSSGTAPAPIILVLDELEQLLSASPENLARALDVVSTLMGRLRSALANPSSPHSGSTVSVMLCSAMHPLMWAPLQSLGGQSLMGALPSVCVTALEDQAARQMMRGLGARQGIRFEEEALSRLVEASQGVPLLLRRLGASVLELYDPDRAREGALGAVRVGVEGALEAIRRELQFGSPLRVWVETEIAGADTAPGAMLRALAGAGRVSIDTLQRIGENVVLERFVAVGLNAHLAAAELKRRAQEAASVMVRLLADSKLVDVHGDATSPEAYSLPDGVLRRILSEGQSK